jgi:hypothetical protein
VQCKNWFITPKKEGRDLAKMEFDYCFLFAFDYCSFFSKLRIFYPFQDDFPVFYYWYLICLCFL